MVNQSNEEMESLLPLGRRGTPLEVAEMAVKLCNPSSTWMTDHIISVNGGMRIPLKK